MYHGIQNYDPSQPRLHVEMRKGDTLSRLLRNMIDDGLVDETVFEGDRRGKILRITPQGRRIRKKMWSIYGPLLREHMSKVSLTGEIENLTDKLNLLCPEGVFEK